MRLIKVEETLLLLKKIPVVKSMMGYSKLSNNVAMTRSNELARLIKNIRKFSFTNGTYSIPVYGVFAANGKASYTNEQSWWYLITRD